MATELDKILSGNKPCQSWTEAQHFGYLLHPRRFDQSPLYVTAAFILNWVLALILFQEDGEMPSVQKSDSKL
jgi:hypothetical protein